MQSDTYDKNIAYTCDRWRRGEVKAKKKVQMQRTLRNECFTL